MKIRAVIFDLDDTLTDRSATILDLAGRWHDVFPGAMRAMPVDSLASILRSADNNGYRPRIEVARDLVQTLPWINPSTPERIVEEWDRQFTERVKANVLADSILNDLKRRGIRIGIVTNGTGWKQRRKIDTMGFTNRIDALVISEEVGVKKPDRKIFEIALDKLRTTPDRCVFIGDNPEFDTLGAHHAGLRAVWFQNQLTWPENLPAYERIATKLDDVMKYID